MVPTRVLKDGRDTPKHPGGCAWAPMGTHVLARADKCSLGAHGCPWVLAMNSSTNSTGYVPMGLPREILMGLAHEIFTIGTHDPAHAFPWALMSMDGWPWLAMGRHGSPCPCTWTDPIV